MTYSNINNASIKKFGTNILADGNVQFSLWAPDATSVKLCLKSANNYTEYFMKKFDDGWFGLITNEASEGSLYYYKIDDNLLVPDPASRYQPEDINGPSQIINPKSFDWEDDCNWKGRPWAEVVLYELHTGTFTEQGTFKALKDKLDYFVDLGITAIELMPVADFPGSRNWGYDGVLLYAPDSSYGNPDDLKELIKEAHKKGLMVFLDVVYNHFGPDGNYLYVYAKSGFFNPEHKTPWGDAINFKNSNVREFFINNALCWLEEYHFDGLRLDAVHTMKDDSEPDFLEELALRVQNGPGKYRHLHLVLENDSNQSCYLRGSSENRYAAQWNDDFHHCIHILTTGEKSSYYQDYIKEKTSKPTSYHLGRILSEGFAYQGEISPYRHQKTRGELSADLSPMKYVNFIQNHDQIGNRAFGDRLATMTDINLYSAAACLYLLAPSIPLMYMGEEWASRSPFLFFCDFEEGLASKVRDGRRNEFLKVSEFNNLNFIKTIPDPTSQDSFIASKLAWKELENFQHQEIYKYYKELLKVRSESILPLISNADEINSSFIPLNDEAVLVEWSFGLDKLTDLAVIANFSCSTLKLEKSIPGKILATSNNLFSDVIFRNIIPPKTVLWLVNDSMERV